VRGGWVRSHGEPAGRAPQDQVRQLVGLPHLGEPDQARRAAQAVAEDVRLARRRRAPARLRAADELDDVRVLPGPAVTPPAPARKAACAAHSACAAHDRAAPLSRPPAAGRLWFACVVGRSVSSQAVPRLLRQRTGRGGAAHGYTWSDVPAPASAAASLLTTHSALQGATASVAASCCATAGDT